VLGQYQLATPGVGGGDNASIRLDDENEPQPDVTLIVQPGYGGRTVLSADDYLEGSPELIAEVAASSVSLDLNARLRAYERNKVLEYVVWRVEDEAVDWFILRRGKYRPLPAGPDGVVRSVTFPGLWMDVGALVRDDRPALLAALNRGLASAEHAAFVARLRAAPKPPKG
jgi:Uma2 family endonuclease